MILRSLVRSDVSPEDKKVLQAFEKMLCYAFKDRKHLKRALTHKSYTNELKMPASEHNERYEYLGDAVLELSISHVLMERFPSHPEGELSKLRAAIVNEHELAELSRRLTLGSFLYLGKGEAMTGGRDKPSLLSDALEAVIGAVYLDRGYAKALNLIKVHFSQLLDNVGGMGFFKDYKTRLQEEAQSRFGAIPKYRLSRESGPDHQKHFEVALTINGETMSVGLGPSKKAAEQDAARQVLDKIAGEMK
ncbi:MAG: ribonuclease III [Deltaproteobacteria bacterium]|nr:ribonuclease III [Deltaproteobacteria bacterium]